ncbi:hypothetical protein SRB17_48260 [Streptomyces sp. RB17]|nr:hypothetical protein [Streptomyces sp. RB17]
MFRRLLHAQTDPPPSRSAPRGRFSSHPALVALVALVLTAFSLAAPAAYAAMSRDAAAAPAQVLTWTAGDGYMGYTSAPTTAVAGPTTIVFENSAATGNTTGMPHTLTFDTSNPDYNTDVSLNIQASPSDSAGGRHTAEVTLTPGVYHYYCAMPGHMMSGELTVTAAPGNDTTAPDTSATVSGTKDASGNYVSSATVTVSASDAESGVATVEYSLDDGAYRDYGAPVQVSGVGQHTVAYRATDKAGNTSAVKSVSFTVVAAPPADTTPPEVSASVSGTKDASGNYVGGATVTVTASDSGSGVATTEYSLDGGPYLSYSAPVAVNRAGSHTFLYRATDKAGNTSTAKSLTLTVVDSKPPTDCPETDDRSTVFVGTVNTGIPNRVTANGCTINELIEDHRTWASHGEFVSYVGDLVADLRHEGVVDQREAGDIKKAAGRSDVGKPHTAHTER